MSTKAEESTEEMDSNQNPEALAEASTEISENNQQMVSEEAKRDNEEPKENDSATPDALTNGSGTEIEPDQMSDQQQSSTSEANQSDPEKVQDIEQQGRNKTPTEEAAAEGEAVPQANSAAPDGQPDQGESDAGKEEANESKTINEATEVETPEQTGPGGTDSSSDSQPKMSETEQSEATGSGGEVTEDQQTKVSETKQNEVTGSTEDQNDTVDSDPQQSKASRPNTDQSIAKKKDTDTKDKKEKKKEKKREKKKSRQASRDETFANQSTTKAANYLEPILLSYFQTADLENSGYVDSETFWEVIQSVELNLQLGPEELTGLQELVEQNQSGMISYVEFSSKAVELISSLYREQPASDHHWVLISAKDKSVIATYNKKTGETRESVVEELDLFREYIESLFQGADVGGKGYVTKEEFANSLQSEQMSPYLTEENVLRMQEYFENIPEGKAVFEDFYPLGKELILGVYRASNPSGSEWLQLNSAQGLVWFNKYTGEARREAADDRDQEIAFIQQTYAEIEAVNFELEQYKQQNKELQNELAQAAEEQETLATQLYETGHLLDEANAEIEARSRELDEARDIILSKEQEIEQFLTQREELEALKRKLEDTENELKAARSTIAVRDQTVAHRDTNISELQRTSDVVTDRLKTMHGEVDARDSTISNLKHKLNFQKMEAQKYEKQVVELEENLSSIEQELHTAKHTLEEKTSALTQARKHLKNSREKTMELEKDSEKLMQTHEKLRSAECEIRTLKSFLTTKTAMIEKNKKELRETKANLAELQEKDRRRAIILADVLEKTAKQFQQQMEVSPAKHTQLATLQTPVETRPASAPAIPPEGDEIDGPEVTEFSSPRVIKSYTVSKGATASSFYRASKDPHTGRAKPRGRSKTVPKLPPIAKRGQVQRQSSFVFPTKNEIRRQHWEKDQQMADHAASNPQCTCELCRMNNSIVGPSTLRPETEATAQTGLSGFQADMDPREMAMARQLKKGQRVVIKMKKSQYDLEPQQLTGIVKYVGKIDSEFIDNRIYVGVKLDEAAGDTDGLIKGKRYFVCPTKHGKIVRISSVVAVLPNKSVFYKPLKGISKRSPYGGAAPKKTSTDSIRVL